MNNLAINRINPLSTASPIITSVTKPVLAIELEQVQKNYADLRVLQQLNLQIKKGEFVAIVGRSGCGKSTLLRLIADLEPVSAGKIKFQSTTTAGHNLRVMFQDPRLLPWKNILQNIQLGLAKKQLDQTQTLLETVGLKQKAKLWPRQLSGGQQQRVALARALAHQPDILLLDEPLSALDALTRLEMQQLIERLWQEQGFTTILVTHDVSEAVQLADRIILLEQGHVREEFNIDLPRPRTKNASFAVYEEKVLNAVLATK